MKAIRLIFIRAHCSLLFIGCAIFFSACHYYKAVPVVSSKTTVPDALKKIALDSSIYVVVHYGDTSWNLKNKALNMTDNFLTGTFDEVGDSNGKYAVKLEDRYTARYKKKNAKDVLNQAHLYISEYAERKDSSVVIPLAAIQKIDTYDKAKGATAASHIAGGILFVGVPIFTVIIIVLSTAGAD